MQINAATRTFKLVLGIVFFTSAFLYFIVPVGLSDVWWHLKTGEWIWQHGEIPQKDPFNYAVSFGYESRKALILKGYWLSELIYFALYSAGGMPALILFNAGVFTLIFLTLWLILREHRMGRLLSFLFISPCVLYAHFFREIRPQSFSFLCMMLLFALIKRLRVKLQGGLKVSHALALPLLMLLWANLHPGFIVGDAVICVYIALETYKLLRKSDDAFQKKQHVKFLLLMVAALIASFCNPNLAAPVVEGISSVGSPMNKTIVEYSTPWHYAADKNSYFGFFILMLIGIVTLGAVAFSPARSFSDVVIYACFGAAGLSMHRFSMFFALVSTAIASRYVAPAEYQLKKLKPLAVILVVASVIFFLVSFVRTGYSRSGTILSRSLPAGAADFMSGHELPPNIFNTYEWGGYLSFRLHPAYSFFIDSRMLDYSVYGDYDAIRRGLKTYLMEKYGINTVVFYPFHPLSRRVQEIVLYLLKDGDWKAVYFDGKSVVFVRSAMSGLPQVEKKKVWNFLVAYSNSQIRKRPGNATGYRSLGDIYLAMGEREKAERAYGAASSLSK